MDPDMEPILSAISLAPSTSLLWSIRPPSTPRRRPFMVILPSSASICFCIFCAAAAFCCISASCSGVIVAICSGAGMAWAASLSFSLDVPVMSPRESASMPWLKASTTVSGRLIMSASLLPSARSSSVPLYVRIPFLSALPNAASTVLASLVLIKSLRSSSDSARMVSGTGEAMPPCCTPTSTMSLI